MGKTKKFITCKKAHDEVHGGITGLSNYMSLNELQEINTRTNCFIGVHSHAHIEIMGKTLPTSLVRFNKELFGNKKELLDVLKEDTYQMFYNYYGTFNTIPNYFCYPYNIENPLYKAIVIQEFKKIQEFLGTNQTSIKTPSGVAIKLYGKGRINVDELQENRN